ncbi:MAG: hypothetical protein IJV26_10950 [Lachnospiraceae bacterium]|nr:hypothetical protein [Lachnospiraceae bacterium]MBQ9644541.1 hypothetical protein [Lachnospiraceae bacterium]
MLNFEEELKKFHPSIEVEDGQNAIYNQDMTDMVDVMMSMMKDQLTAPGNQSPRM